MMIVAVAFYVGCANGKRGSGGGGAGSQSDMARIENPFGDFHLDTEAQKQNIVLRTKKGDRAVEVEFPGGHRTLTEFVVPMSPEFAMDGARAPASQNGIDNTYVETKPTVADREITEGFPQGSPDQEWKRREIESELGLMKSEDNAPRGDASYLASIDKIKQLYKTGRFEGGLIEVDQLIRLYPTDPKLHEMRGTMLDRLGYIDLAIKSWQQALEFNPNNLSLKKFIERKVKLTRGVASQ